MSRASAFLVMITMALLIVGCGSSGKKSTKDNSVDYKTAKRLPALRKPSLVTQSVDAGAPASQSSNDDVDAQTATVAENSTQAASDQAQAVPEDQIVGEALAVDETVQAVYEETQDVDTAQAVNSVAQAGDSVAQAADSVAQAVDDSPNLTAEITTLKNNIARLKVNGSYNEAWDYLAARLARSSVTVFTRNKKAGRFAIGCGAFEQAPASDEGGGGGWAIFNRKRPANNDNCTLEVSSSRNNVVVSAIDRDGDEVGKAGSIPVFEQIINN